MKRNFHEQQKAYLIKESGILSIAIPIPYRNFLYAGV
jgi:hypothetical protein